jgi:octaprenyl-diphosphate synthase
LADLDDEQENALARYGHNVGMAFQLIDDMLDFVGDQQTLGKPVVNDLTEGKLTLPVILLLERASADELSLVKRILAERQASDAEQSELVAVLNRHGTLESTARLAAEYGRRALKGLTAFPESPAKSVLEKVPDLLLSRTA